MKLTFTVTVKAPRAALKKAILHHHPDATEATVDNLLRPGSTLYIEDLGFSRYPEQTSDFEMESELESVKP